MARIEDIDPSVALPPGLDAQVVRRCVNYMEEQLADLAEIYLEQANVFSALVGIFGTKALDSLKLLRETPALPHRAAAFP